MANDTHGSDAGFDEDTTNPQRELSIFHAQALQRKRQKEIIDQLELEQPKRRRQVFMDTPFPAMAVSQSYDGILQDLAMQRPQQVETISQPQRSRRGQVFMDTPFPSLSQAQILSHEPKFRGWRKQHPCSSSGFGASGEQVFAAPVYYCANPDLLKCSSKGGKDILIESGDDIIETRLVVDDELTRIKLLRATTPTHGAPNVSTIVSYSLETFSWKSHPDFIAFSYVWGTDAPDNIILVNDDKYYIQNNLFTALSHFSQDNLSYLWADAICIDQTDEEEKSHVVQHMGDIFRRASKVIAWLGPLELNPRPDTSKLRQWDLIDNLEYLGSLFWEKSGAGTKKLNEVSPDLSKTLQLCLSGIKDCFGNNGDGTNVFPVSAYARFSNNPYWQRIWVLQEAYLAQDLWFQCGPKSISMRTLSGALILLERFQKFIISASEPAAVLLRAMPQVREFAMGSPSFPEMHHLVIYTSIYPAGIVSLRVAMANFCVKELPRGSRATDPRDMIFGLLGFATEHEKAYIKADYTKSVRDVYRDVTRALISSGFGDVLSWSQRSQKELSDLPSWVPDFSSTIYEPLCSQGQAKPWLPRFNASSGRPVVVWSNPEEAGLNSNTLSLLGVTFDEVCSLGDIWYPRDHHREYSNDKGLLHGATMSSRSASYAAIRKFLDEIRTFASTTRLDGFEVKTVINEDIACRVACADQLMLDSRLRRVSKDCPDLRDYYLRALHNVRDQFNHGADESMASQAQPYLETILRWVNKRPFRTHGGHVGLAPAETEPGDLAVIFPGFSAPYVLRRVGDDARMYELVGECYVYGVMDGEYLGATETVLDLFRLV
ncbi:heterokaryon incompatibility protein-domain-containing protein [Immersiella caudata]|uniref:Heterokaryon incompatibility protein-domain-containing protein n=1 Tax=Immersiella caudata TaxID=314043 RepID=A0AA39XEK0_9PEZI|nr:heterokaryon incompatibility protein-domain-containing protein [Immersiella caudata]